MSTEHDERMLPLLAHSSIRKLKLDIVNLSRENLKDELTQIQCNPNGDTEILRERLLRAILKESRYGHLIQNEPNGDSADSKYYEFHYPQ